MTKWRLYPQWIQVIKNTIQLIKLKNSFSVNTYANSATHNPFPSPTFEFPPGHRIRICNFVKEVKKLRESCGSDQVRSDKNVHTGKRRKPESNPRSNPENNVPSENKRQKLHVEDSEEEVDVQESKVLTVMGVSKQVRSSLRKWMAKQKNDQLGQLHEGEHYSLQIIPKGTAGVFLVSIKCLACGKSVMLHQAKSSVMVSNWYRHAKLCFKKQAGKKFIQLPIHGYTGGSQSESDIATESSSSSKVSDAESDTTINGPLVDLAGFNKS